MIIQVPFVAMHASTIYLTTVYL